MTVHYHGTPITPRSVLQELSGKNFCVSYAEPRDIEVCHQIGQSVMLDNGAYTLWRRNCNAYTYALDGFYEWARPWLDYKTTWLIIPDVINGAEEENDRLIEKSLNAFYGLAPQLAPVWHMHEPIDRLRRLCDRFIRVCIGSSGEFANIGTNRWNQRMNETFNTICKRGGPPPAWIHMLRGMALSGSVYPFASVDSTDVARHHSRKNNPKEMADDWDAIQCPAVWTERPVQMEMVAAGDDNASPALPA